MKKKTTRTRAIVTARAQAPEGPPSAVLSGHAMTSLNAAHEVVLAESQTLTRYLHRLLANVDEQSQLTAPSDGPLACGQIPGGLPGARVAYQVTLLQGALTLCEGAVKEDEPDVKPEAAAEAWHTMRRLMRTEAVRGHLRNAVAEAKRIA